jgi:hypothetical protein
MSYGVAISTVIEALKGVVCALEIQQTFSGRMCHHREAHETDVQTLDRVLAEAASMQDNSKIEALEPWEWRIIITSMDYYITACRARGSLSTKPGFDIVSLQNKIRGRGEE